jgi:hypothetical protein
LRGVDGRLPHKIAVVAILLYTSALRIAPVDYDNREDCTVLTGGAAKIVARIDRKYC